MSLNFPHYADLPLSKPPLKEVICQIRFAPLLEIVQKLPAEFQTRIRKDFPNFEVSQNVAPDLNQILPSEYAFKTSNDQSRVSLAVNFVALSTKEYSHWTIFREQTKNSLDALSKLYGPIYVSRIGLRYINELTTKNTSFKSLEELLEIVNDDLTQLALNEAWSTPKGVAYHLLLEDDENELSIRVGMNGSAQPTLLLDFDYFAEIAPNQQLDVTATLERLDKFHERCYDAFRWSIKDEGLAIFGPENS